VSVHDANDARGSVLARRTQSLRLDAERPRRDLAGPEIARNEGSNRRDSVAWR
jgi:hypothetical protein